MNTNEEPEKVNMGNWRQLVRDVVDENPGVFIPNDKPPSPIVGALVELSVDSYVRKLEEEGKVLRAELAAAKEREQGLREELKLAQFRLKAADQGLQELDEENARFRIALTEIASYDKEKKHGDGICPYGCDTPFIAQTALSRSSWSPWRTSSITPTPSSAGVKADPYLCITVDSVRPVILTYIYADKQWTLGEGDSQKVSFWMPLPQPPTKGGESHE